MSKYKLLDNSEVDAIKNLFTSDRGTWDDGKKSTGKLIANQKSNNEFFFKNKEDYNNLWQIIKAKILSIDELRQKYYIDDVLPIIISRMREGDYYKLHVDNPFMYRKIGLKQNDLSFTISLSKKEDYQGGELKIGDFDIKKKIKLDLGDIVIYNTGTEHEVLPVTNGERLVIVGWISSMIPEPNNRQLLNRIDELREIIYDNSFEQKDRAITLIAMIRTYLEKKYINVN
jgi:PKHD-type hydroxylase